MPSLHRGFPGHSSQNRPQLFTLPFLNHTIYQNLKLYCDVFFFIICLSHYKVSFMRKEYLSCSQLYLSAQSYDSAWHILGDQWNICQKNEYLIPEGASLLQRSLWTLKELDVVKYFSINKSCMNFSGYLEIMHRINVHYLLKPKGNFLSKNILQN